MHLYFLLCLQISLPIMRSVLFMVRDHHMPSLGKAERWESQAVCCLIGHSAQSFSWTINLHVICLKDTSVPSLTRGHFLILPHLSTHLSVSVTYSDRIVNTSLKTDLGKALLGRPLPLFPLQLSDKDPFEAECNQGQYNTLLQIQVLPTESTSLKTKNHRPLKGISGKPAIFTPEALPTVSQKKKKTCGFAWTNNYPFS